ncbi:MAG: hypothetical protein OXC62_14335 [Aestuariivita sp.]|nr:hypothetical protein [Aestuariivita sp.]
MSITHMRIDPNDPSILPEGRIDPSVIDATTDATIAVQKQKDEAEALQAIAHYT